jgi:hypothetical protein
VIIVLATAALPASALADGGVLLSGYAPPGAGEEAILGAAPAGGPARSTARSATAARSTMPLAQPDAPAATRRQTPAPAVTPARAHGGKVARKAARSAKPTAREPRVVAANTASPAIVAAATGAAPGSGVGLWQALLAAALASITFVLGRAWLRRDQ